MHEMKKILVVDDLLDNIEILGGILRPDFEVKMALSGSKALKVAETTPQPDLILLDIMMPEMDGYEVCRRVKHNPATRNIPVIFVSARNEAVNEVLGLELGAVDYITKPVTPAIVKARVRTHLNLAAARKELEKQNYLLQDNIRLREDIDRLSRHDLKSPLSVFLSVPEMLKRAPNITPDQVQLLNLLLKGARHLMETIHRSLDLDKMERGEYRLSPVPVNLVKVLAEVFQELGTFAERKHLSWEMMLDKKPIGPEAAFELEGEESLYFSLFSNLVKNAMEASPEGGKVSVELSRDSVPTISIRNRGAIPEPIRDRFFQRYVTFGKDRGTGLGAYSARLMARTLGGDLTFTTDESVGTVLFFTLPPAGAARKTT